MRINKAGSCDNDKGISNGSWSYDFDFDGVGNGNIVNTKCNNDGNHGAKVVVTINGIISYHFDCDSAGNISFVNSKFNNYRDNKKTYNHR